MINNDYTKEIGMNTDQRIVPMRYVLPVLVTVLALGVWLGFTSSRPEQGAKPAAVAAGK